MKRIVKATNVKKSSIKVENVTKKKHKNIKLKNVVAADKSKPAKKSKSVKKGTAAKPGSAPDDLPSSPLEDARLAATCCLRWMLAPVTTDQFFNEFWEQQPLLVSRSSSTHYASVFSTDHFDRILREELIHYGRNLDVTSYSCGQRETHNPVGRAHAPVVWDYYSNGCSLRLINPQTYSQSVWRLCSTLQEYFGTLVGANVYLTPAGTQGFAPHYDDIEGFLLQLEGAKHWRVYKAREGEQLARVSSVNFSEDDITQETDTASDTSPSRSPPCRLIPPPELLIDAVLHAGDLLYIPRGCIHQGRALCNQHSLHITVSTYQRTSWADLLEKVIPVALQRAISENVQLRRGLPVGYHNYMGLVHDHQQHSPVNTKLREEFFAEAASLIDKVCRNLPLDAAVDQQVKQYLMDALPPTLTSEELKRTVHNDGERWSEGRVRGRAVIDPVTEVKLVRPSAVRLVNECGQLRLYYCVHNTRVYHEIDEQFLDVDKDEYGAAISRLVHSYPLYTAVHHLLPNVGADEQVAFVSSLWEKGLLITKTPLLE